MEPGNVSQLVALLGEGVAWYDVEPKLKPKLKSKPDHEPLKATDELVLTLKHHAQELLETEVARFELQKSGKISSDDKYLATMMRAGTLSDRVAALTLTTQASPLHSLVRLGQLISMASKKARRESLLAIESLKDLFLHHHLLPNTTTLRPFHHHPLRAAQHSSAHLVLWFFEHCLKTAYRQLTSVLASGMDDAIASHKRACLRTAHALLQAKPEQEARLLAMLVNKLGDPDRKVVAYLHGLVQELLHAHPAMKRVMVDEVERLLTRPNISDRAKYHAVLCLNQVYLDTGTTDAHLASHLISVYFGLFTNEVHVHDEATRKKKRAKTTIKTLGPMANDAMDRKLLSALLVGVNRAFPYANATSAPCRTEIDALFQVVHRAHLGTSVQALMLLFQVMSSTNSVSDRFYTALYHKILDPRVPETSKHTLFLNVLYRAMKADVVPARVGAFMKRLLQVASGMPPAFACAVLLMLSELLKAKPQLRPLVTQPEPSTASGCLGHDEPFDDRGTVAGARRHDLDQAEGLADAASPSKGDGEATETERSATVLARLFGRDEESTGRTKVVAAVVDTRVPRRPKMAHEAGYDATKRNPLFARADTACLWEVHLLLHHYHPSVQSFARQLVENPLVGIRYAGDPLVDFTLHAFFEKFVTKKPRHRGAATSCSRGANAKNRTLAPLQTEGRWPEHEVTVDASDHFFDKFFNERAAREATHGTPRRSRRGHHHACTADVFAEAGEDDAMDTFAQELAEGMMEDDGLQDEEDFDGTRWSDSDEDQRPAIADGSGHDVGRGHDDAKSDGRRSEDQTTALSARTAQRTRDRVRSRRDKRKRVFASADDYDAIVQRAMESPTRDEVQHSKGKLARRA